MNQELPHCEKAVNAAVQFSGGHRGQDDNCAAGKQRGMSRVGCKGWEPSEKMCHLIYVMKEISRMNGGGKGKALQVEVMGECKDTDTCLL